MIVNVKKIAVIAGDGIGPEVMAEAEKILRKIEEVFELSFVLEHGLIGGIALDKTGLPLPESTWELCKNSDAILLGAVGGPKWDNNPKNLRPEAGLSFLRKELGLFSNLRPIKVIDAVKGISSLKPEVLDGTDLIIVRELTGGIYYGDKSRNQTNEGIIAVDVSTYGEKEIENIARKGFEIAQTRRKKVTSVDKVNALETSRLWRETVNRISEDYPDVELEHLLIDNCAFQLLKRPSSFDVILTENMFGDILSDESAMLVGSLGMLSSASIGKGSFGLYEPVHGSAPDIAGKDIANPIAMILSISLMLRLSFGYHEAASAIENAVEKVLNSGYRTYDIAINKSHAIGTKLMGDYIASAIQR